MMIDSILKITTFVLSKFGMKEAAPVPGKKPNHIYMKRAVFVFSVILVAWGLYDPESLGMKLEHMSEVLPGWFTSLLATVFAGVWI